MFKNFFYSTLLKTLILYSVFCLLSSLSAKNSVGKTSAEFLKIEAGAKPASMGGAYTAAGRDAYSFFYNPASLADISQYEVGFQLNNWFLDINQNYITGVIPTERFGVFGASINYVDLGNLEKTTVTSGQAGQTLGTFDANDMALTFAWARDWGNTLRGGGALKWINSHIENEDANAFAVDAGLKFSPADIWDMGLSIQNLGTNLTYMSDGDVLPLSVRFGNAVRLINDDLTLSMDIIKYRYTNVDVSIGAEYDLLKMVGFRIGYNSRNSDLNEGLTAGVGFHFNGFNVDYGYVPYGELGNSHRVSIGYKFGSPVSKKNKPKKAVNIFRRKKREIKKQPIKREVVKKEEKKKSEEEVTLERYRKYEKKQTEQRKQISVKVLRFKGINLPENTAWLEKASQDILISKLNKNGIITSDNNYTYILKGTLRFIDSSTINVQISVYDKDNNYKSALDKTGSPNTIISLLEALSGSINFYR